MKSAKLCCMSLVYANESFERALQGIAGAGFTYVAFGLPHQKIEVPDEDNPQAAAQLERLFSQYDLEPSMLLGTKQFVPGQPVERAVKRLQLAKALGIREVMSLGTFGYETFPDLPWPDHVMKSRNEAFNRHYQRIAEEAEKLDVFITLKPHTGNTATSESLLATIGQIGSSHVKASYDPGNVSYYEGIDVLEDFRKLPGLMNYSFVLKDHLGQRGEANFPVPGKGHIPFPQMLELLREQGFAGNLFVERVDGTDRRMTDADALDARLGEARSTIMGMLEQIGLAVAGP